MKKGFTLAELLITMGIVGVVAALVAPGLIINNRNAANASKLSSTVSDLENALTTMIVKEQVDTIFDTEAWDKGGSLSSTSSDATMNSFAGELGKYTYIIANTKNKKPSNFYKTAYSLTNSGDKGGAHSFSSSFGSNGAGFNLKNGAVIFLHLQQADDSDEADKQADEIAMEGGSLTRTAGQVLLDVNGQSAPNTIGRDIFGFEIGSDGHLYPIGGRDYAIFKTKTASWAESDIWKNSSSKTACTDSQKADSGFGCTARLIEDGYKVTY